jgi:quercetin dioxygenase-like cupin family protein
MTAPVLAPAKAFPLSGLVDYAEGSVVSRTLVKRRSGTVTLFAFDAGQGLSEHSAPHDALVQVLDGTVELRIGGEEVVATAGQVVLLPAGVLHALHARERFRMLLTMIRD